MRQVETKTKLMAQNTTADQNVSFGKLISCATRKEKCLMYLGWVCAFLTGVGMPLFAAFLSRIFNSFKYGIDPKKMLNQVQEIFFMMLGVGVVIGLLGYGYWALLLRFSQEIARRTKESYLAAILKQETGWFDSFNYNEMSARITKETLTINKAIGEKAGLIVMSVGMVISGFLIGLFFGWSLCLAMFAIGPLIGVCAAMFGIMLNSKSAKGLKSYA